MTCTGIINMCIQNTLANQECDMYCIKKTYLQCHITEQVSASYK